MRSDTHQFKVCIGLSRNNQPARWNLSTVEKSIQVDDLAMHTQYSIINSRKFSIITRTKLQQIQKNHLMLPPFKIYKRQRMDEKERKTTNYGYYVFRASPCQMPQESRSNDIVPQNMVVPYIEDHGCQCPSRKNALWMTCCYEIFVALVRVPLYIAAGRSMIMGCKRSSSFYFVSYSNFLNK